jgi:hypothetical protein
VIVRELVAQLGFDLKDTNLKKFESGIHSAVAVAAASLYHIIKTTAETGDNLSKMSQRSGINVETLQKLGASAKVADLDMGEFVQTLTIFSKKMYGADEDGGGKNKIDKALKDLGISANDAKGNLKPTDELLLQISDKFKSMPDGIKKTGIAMELYGRSGSRLIPFLNQGSEGIARIGHRLEMLNAVLTTEEVKNAEGFNDALKETHITIEAIKNTVAAKFMPYFKSLIDSFDKWLEVNQEIVRSGIDRFVRELISLFETLWKWGGSVADTFSTLSEIFGGTAGILNALVYLVGSLVAIKLGSWIESASIMMLKLRNVSWETVLPLLEFWLIAAAIAAVGVAIMYLIGDFQNFEEGVESTFDWSLMQDFILVLNEDLIPAFKSAWEWIKEVGEMFKISFGPVGDFLGNIVTKIDAFIERLTGVSGVLSRIGNAMNPLNLIPGMGGLTNLASDIRSRAQQIRAGRNLSDGEGGTGPLGLPNMSELQGAAASLSIVPSAGLLSGAPMINKNNRFDFQTKIDVNVQSPASPDEIRSAVENGVNEALDNQFRTADREVNGGL